MNLYRCTCALAPGMAVVLLLAGCSKDNGNPEQAASRITAPVDTLTITSYNVENLFDASVDGGEYDEFLPGKSNWDKSLYSAKLDSAAVVLTAVRADVVVLCEIENNRVLNDLKKDLAGRGLDYGYTYLGDKPDHSNIYVALLSRFPIVKHEGMSVAGQNSPSFRNILRADIAVGAETLTVFCSHWPSKMHPESYRVAIAQTIADQVKLLGKKRDYCIAGDLNSDYNEADIFFKTKRNDTQGKTGLNHVLGTVSSAPGKPFVYITKDKMCHANVPAHYDPWNDVPAVNRYSQKYQGHDETLDHILLSPALFDSNGWSYLDGSFMPVTLGMQLVRGGVPFRWQIKKQAGSAWHTNEGYSDHLPVVVRLYKGPFSLKPSSTTDSGHLSPMFQGPKLCGFEEGSEGWGSCFADITVGRNSLRPASGKYDLAIKGCTGLQNGCIARTIVPCKPPAPSGSMALQCEVRGTGRFLMRLRSGNLNWIYYCGPDFSARKTAKYEQIVLKQWKQVQLPLCETIAANTNLEIELRAAKNSVVDIYLDNIQFVSTTNHGDCPENRRAVKKRSRH